MFTYILIGCFVAVITDYISFVFMGNRNGLPLIGAAFVALFWPMVVIYLAFYFIGELLEAIGRLVRKKG